MHPPVSVDNGVRPVGSVFLLRAAPDVAQQSNPSHNCCTQSWMAGLSPRFAK